MITNKEVGYVCGWLDADGSMGLHKQERKGAKWGFDYTPCVRLANTDKKVIEYLLKILGIKRNIFSRKTPSGRKTIYEVSFNKYDHVKKILIIADSLITKKRQGDLLLEFVTKRVERILECNPTIKNGRMYSGRNGFPSYTKRDDEIYRELIKLNQRGINVNYQ